MSSHVPMCEWCGEHEVGSWPHFASEQFCSPECENAALAFAHDEAESEKEEAEASLPGYERLEYDYSDEMAQYDDDPNPYHGDYSEE
jgi:hypothetical protein